MNVISTLPSMRTLSSLLWLAAAVSFAAPAGAWGDQGHEVIALVADRYLEPGVRLRVNALLAADDTGLCERDIAHEATWADKYRDSDRDASKVRYYATRNWHFVDLELQSPDLTSACHGRPPLPPGTPASRGPADDCIVDKIDQFESELRDPRTDAPERLLALQFLLHLVGDVHQPLHASDDHDQGGNRKIVSAPGIATQNLHHDWDTEFVARLGERPRDIAERLLARITDEQRRQWSHGTASDWAMESFSVAKAHTYGLLPAAGIAHGIELPESYVLDATQVTAEQLSKAGVRLAFVLNQALR